MKSQLKVRVHTFDILLLRSILLSGTTEHSGKMDSTSVSNREVPVWNIGPDKGITS